MRIAIASDHAAVALRLELGERLVASGHQVTDMGCHDGDDD